MNRIVNFQIAALAKEKKFNDECFSAYKVWRGKIRKTQDEETALESYVIGFERCGIDNRIEVLETFNQCEDYTLAPTVGELIEWLWTNHNILLSFSFGVKENGFIYTIQVIDNNEIKKNVSSKGFNKREQSINSGLIESLNLLVYKPNV